MYIGKEKGADAHFMSVDYYQDHKMKNTEHSIVSASLFPTSPFPGNVPFIFSTTISVIYSPLSFLSLAVSHSFTALFMLWS